MNKSHHLILITLLLLFAACQKDKTELTLTSTVNIINAAVDVPGIKVNTSGGVINYSAAPAINYGAGSLNFVPRTAIPVTLVKSSDSSTLVSSTINFQSGIYSLYLIGQAPTVETMLVEEINFPFIRLDVTQPTSDSVVNVRFINLSPNSGPVKIKIASASTNEVDNLPYKGIGNWKAYSALLATTNYSFQIRDAVTDALITTYSFTANSTNRFKNVTLIIRGLQGTTSGTNAFGVSAVNYF